MGHQMHRSEVKRIRLGLGLTQQELGERLGYLHGLSVSNWEVGTASVPPHAAALLRAWEKGIDIKVEARGSRRRGPKMPKEPLTAAE